MLDRDAVKEFLDEEFAKWSLEIPQDVNKAKLVETFCLYTEDDYYEWLKDNFKWFFNHGDPQWDRIRDRIESYESS